MWNVVDGPFDDGNGKMWHLICDCGNESLVRDYDFRSGKSTQCRTCAVSKPKSELGRRFAHLSKEVVAKVRAAAQNAIERCTNTSHKRYDDWGGRGIEVRFPDKDSFIEYMLMLPGHDDINLVIDRIDNDKHYEVGNLRWTTRSESQYNQRNKGGEHGYYMRNRFARCFKRMHDKGHSFEKIGNLYCANPATVRNCVRELERSNAINS